MADFSTTTPVPGITSTYTSVLSIINDKFTDLVRGLDTTPSTNQATATNVPINGIMWTSSLNKWRKWDGTAWQNLSNLYDMNISGNAATSTTCTGTADIGSKVPITNDTTTNASVYPVWVTGTSSGTTLKISSTKLSLNPSTGTLTADGVTSASFLLTGPYNGGGIFIGTGDVASSTTANVQVKSWYGIGFAPSITGQTVPQNENAVWINVRTGDVSSRGNLTAYASDERLKKNFKIIENALSKVKSISGYYFDWDVDLCTSLGFAPSDVSEHGLKAQEIKRIMPDSVKRAPFDDDGNGSSKSGNEYLTVKYDKLVPLLVEAIKELEAEVAALKLKIK